MCVADHLSAELLEDYRLRRLEPAQLLALDDHVTVCSACREKLQTIPVLKAAISLRENLESPQSVDEHLADDRVHAYVEGRLDAVDRELVESHIENCKLCHARAERFHTFVP